MSEHAKTLIVSSVIWFVLCVSFAIVSNMEYEDGRLRQQEYCTNVAQGLWPDYNENFKEVCNETDN